MDALERAVTSMADRVAHGAMIRVQEVSELLTKAELAGLVSRDGMALLPPEESRFVRLERIPDTLPRELGMVPAFSMPVINHVREAVCAFRAAAAGQPFTGRREVYAAAYAAKQISGRFKPLI